MIQQVKNVKSVEGEYLFWKFEELNRGSTGRETEMVMWGLVTICLALVPSPPISLSPVLALDDMDVNNIDIPDEKIDNTEENDNTGNIIILVTQY